MLQAGTSLKRDGRQNGGTLQQTQVKGSKMGARTIISDHMKWSYDLPSLPEKGA